MNDEEADLRRAIERDQELIAETAAAISRKTDVASRARDGAVVVAVLVALGILLGLALTRRR